MQGVWELIVVDNYLKNNAITNNKLELLYKKITIVLYNGWF
jgi:hypothetical protein